MSQGRGPQVGLWRRIHINQEKQQLADLREVPLLSMLPSTSVWIYANLLDESDAMYVMCEVPVRP